MYFSLTRQNKITFLVLKDKNSLNNICYYHNQHKIESRIKYHPPQRVKRLGKVSKSNQEVSRIRISRSGDVETNPGPELKVITFNCRGLSDRDKMRMIILGITKLTNSYEQYVICLQETYIVNDSYLRYIRKGTYVLTPGTSHSKGCITLLPKCEYNLVTELDSNRGHILRCNFDSGEIINVANIYAPNGFNESKFRFFENLLHVVTDLNRHTIVAGDLNITLRENERNGTIRCNAEKRW